MAEGLLTEASFHLEIAQNLNLTPYI